jgi:hypothetical protein
MMATAISDWAVVLGAGIIIVGNATAKCRSRSGGGDPITMSGANSHRGVSGHSLRCGSILIIDRCKHYKLIVRPFRWTEGVLAEAEKTRLWVMEYSQTAGPVLNILVIPRLRE